VRADINFARAKKEVRFARRRGRSSLSLVSLSLSRFFRVFKLHKLNTVSGDVCVLWCTTETKFVSKVSKQQNMKKANTREENEVQ
jgi:hypothetical protein